MLETIILIGVVVLILLVMVLVVLSTMHTHCMKCIYNEYHKTCDNDKPNENIIDRWK